MFYLVPDRIHDMCVSGFYKTLLAAKRKAAYFHAKGIYDQDIYIVEGRNRIMGRSKAGEWFHYAPSIVTIPWGICVRTIKPNWQAWRSIPGEKIGTEKSMKRFVENKFSKPDLYPPHIKVEVFLYPWYNFNVEPIIWNRQERTWKRYGF